jgi:hypothetical protein
MTIILLARTQDNAPRTLLRLVILLVSINLHDVHGEARRAQAKHTRVVGVNVIRAAFDRL